VLSIPSNIAEGSSAEVKYQVPFAFCLLPPAIYIPLLQNTLAADTVDSRSKQTYPILFYAIENVKE